MRSDHLNKHVKTHGNAVVLNPTTVNQLGNIENDVKLEPSQQVSQQQLTNIDASNY